MNPREKIVLGLIVLLPLIDIATSFTANSLISAGIIIRMCLLAIIFIYFFKNFTRKYIPILLLLGSILLTFGINFFQKEPFYFFSELQFFFKTIYMVMMLFIVMDFLQRKVIRKIVLLQGAVIAAMIVGGSFWLAIVTDSARASYAYTKFGTSGWFFAANELGVIVLILLGLSLVAFQEGLLYSGFIASIVLISILPLIGTKTAMYGAVLMMLVFAGLHVLLHQGARRAVVLFSTSALIFGGIFIGATNEQSYQASSIEKVSAESGTPSDLLSSRDIFYKNTLQDYKLANMERKLFGLGFAGDYKIAPKTIEMDFYDLFFSYGMIGLILATVLMWALIRQLLPLRRDPTYLLLSFTLVLVAGIAFLAGHVLFAPAVMSYVAILLLMIGLQTNGESYI